ncbi:hypothetical protein GCM10010271_41730 [Streptomyces kurssanovii]|nr:hypothetical protein GCM10010271_41730 [Streptomyces kurssanovii]
MLFLNRGLSRGSMSVVVPVSAVTGVALSVLCGVWLLGDRPTATAWAGICVTVPALWLVAGGSRGARDGGEATRTGHGVTDGLIASLGVAVQYIGLARPTPSAACGPLPAAASPLSPSSHPPRGDTLPVSADPRDCRGRRSSSGRERPSL